MIYYFLLAVSIILTVCKSSVYNVYAKKATPTLFDTFAFNGMTYGVAAVISLIVMLFGDKSFSPSTALCAIAYAGIVFSLQTVSIAAMSAGTMSLTSIFVMYGMIIPSLAGPVFWKEPFGVLQGVGIIAMLISLWLLKGKNNGEKIKTTKKWMLLAVIAFLLSGMAGLMEKIHQSTEGKNEKAMFVFVACLAMLFCSLASAFATRKRKSKNFNFKAPLLLGVTSGLIVGFYSIVNLTLAGELDSMIYYPVANGGAMLLTVIVSSTVFREKLDLLKSIGMIVGLLGIVALSIPT